MSRRLIALALVGLAACEHGQGGGVPSSDAGGGSGLTCGGFGGELCPVGEFCDFPRNSCGAADEAGTCRSRPNACPELFQPTCGCDGLVHDSACDANGAGVDISDNGNCRASPGQFICGHTFCNVADQYCQRATSDVGGEPDSFGCNELPAGCTANDDCSCLADEPCGTICSGDPDSGFEVTCPGG